VDDKERAGEGAPGEGTPGALSAGVLSGDTMSAQIDDLDARIARLGAYIDARHDACAVADLCRLLDLHSTMLSRVTRMRQVQDALYGGQTRMMILLYSVLDDVVEGREVGTEPEQREPERREPGRPGPGRRKTARRASPWVQGTMRFAAQG
jgi:hypothetical protein